MDKKPYDSVIMSLKNVVSIFFFSWNWISHNQTSVLRKFEKNLLSASSGDEVLNRSNSSTTENVKNLFTKMNYTDLTDPQWKMKEKVEF